MKKSLLGAIALGVGGSAVAGFGAAAGRDLWKGTKKATGTLILLTAIAASVSLPFLGMRNLIRGHAPGEGWKAIREALLVPLGIAIGVGVAIFSALMLGKEPFALAIITIVGSGLAAALIGAIVGLGQRPSTQRRYKIAMANEEFLDRLGIRETGEIEISHIDGQGNALRLIERTANSIVFMAVGKRNKRAYIGLSPQGEMQSYTGVVALGSSREMDTAA
ncbi:hypothetical protein ASD64_19200 [Mesorhizobium sp. Root157]|uniref:hypothetical protein n=1 Tax=Mesorhizobium sp. Root157 TaxID=1736477 RepID=UPI0006F99D12|nr:hypothetical protein [Mesorhizobium sp. Root157]KQZ92777.1 hypothetical protein ASD64_19200 [Mesorhizobium sp. Root157]